MRAAITSPTGEPVPNDFKKFLRSLSEREFRELVLVPLLEAMNYRHIRVTHGPREAGKDVVFEYSTPLDGAVYLALVIKAGRITGNVASSSSARALVIQAQQCFDTPYLRADGVTVSITRVYVCSNHELTTEAKESVRGALNAHRGQIDFVGLDELLTFIREYLPTLFNSRTTAVSGHIKELFDSNYFVKHLHLLGSSRQIPLFRCYVPATLELFEDRLVSDAPGTAAAELSRAHPFLLVCGGPGSGKSTLVQKQILDLITDNDVRPKRHVPCLPVLVPLRHLPTIAIQNKKQFVQAIERMAPALGPHLAEVKRLQSVHLFLDGIDEIYDTSVRAALILLAGQIPTLSLFDLPITACTITSRTYAASAIKNFKTAYVRPFGSSEIRAFAARWFERDAPRARRFSDSLLSRPDLKHLAASPLLLTLIAAVTEKRASDIQGSRTGLYELAIQMLADKWDEERGLQLGPSGDETLRFLMFLAMELFDLSVMSADDALLDRVAKRLVEEGVALPKAADSATVLARYQRTGLIVTNEFGNVAFGHRSLAEFCCARHIYTLHLEARLKRSILREEWWNVVSFYFGLLRRLDYADAALLKSLTANPYLELECVIEADRTPVKLREGVIGSVVADLASGKLSFTNEALALVRLGSDQILAYAENLLTRQGAIQASFYVAVVDLLTHFNDRRSRMLLRRFDGFLRNKELTLEQTCTMMASYLAGANSVCADLLEDHFNRIDALTTARAVIGALRGAPADRRRRGLVERLSADIILAAYLEGQMNQPSDERAVTVVDIALLKRMMRERAGPLGALFVARAMLWRVKAQIAHARQIEEQLKAALVERDDTHEAYTAPFATKRSRRSAQDTVPRARANSEASDAALLRAFVDHLKRYIAGPIAVRVLDILIDATTLLMNSLAGSVTVDGRQSASIDRANRARRIELKKVVGDIWKLKDRQTEATRIGESPARRQKRDART